MKSMSGNGNEPTCYINWLLDTLITVIYMYLNENIGLQKN